MADPARRPPVRVRGRLDPRPGEGGAAEDPRLARRARRVGVWLAASGGLALYSASFGSFEKTWGTLSAVVVTLIWLWLGGAALLFGAEIDAEVEASRLRETSTPVMTKDADRLFGLPLAEFTGERDALVRKLRDEGRRDEAAEIAALRKPVLAAWVVNQLVRQRRAEVRELVRAAEAVKSGRRDADERFRTAAEALGRSARAFSPTRGEEPPTPCFATSRPRFAPRPPPTRSSSSRGGSQPIEATGFEAMAGAAVARRGGRRDEAGDERRTSRMEAARRRSPPPARRPGPRTRRQDPRPGSHGARRPRTTPPGASRRRSASSSGSERGRSARWSAARTSPGPWASRGSGSGGGSAERQLVAEGLPGSPQVR